MITKGSKIKLVKAMGEFNNIGEVCDVIKVTEDGVISFRFGNGMHLGCMSYDEYGKYFVDYVEPEKVAREWSEWKTSQVPFTDFDEERILYAVEFRDNKKKVQVKCVDGSYSGLTGEATCCNSDDFNFEDGYKLAVARLLVKIAKKDAELLASFM